MFTVHEPSNKAEEHAACCCLLNAERIFLGEKKSDQKANEKQSHKTTRKKTVSYALMNRERD